MLNNDTTAKHFKSPSSWNSVSQIHEVAPYTIQHNIDVQHYDDEVLHENIKYIGKWVVY